MTLTRTQSASASHPVTGSATRKALLTADLLNDYLDIRKSERSEWSAYGQRKGEINVLKKVSDALVCLKENGISTLENLDGRLQKVIGKAKDISAELRKTNRRMKDIFNIEKAVAECRTHKVVHGGASVLALYYPHFLNPLNSYFVIPKSCLFSSKRR